MGGTYGSPPPQNMGKILQAYAKYLPSVLQATAGEATPIALANLGATQATEPQLQQLNEQLTAQYAPELAGINSQVQRQQALQGSETLGQQISGPGGQAAQSAASLLAQTNPAYAATEGAAAGQAQNLLGSYDLNGLTPGEEAAVERSTNQTNTATGNLGLSNPTNVISNAMNFGQAYNAKRAALNTAIGTATGTASTAAGAFNPVGIATGQPGTSGITQFGQTGTGSTSTGGALQFGQGLLGNQTSMNNAAIGSAASMANANSIPSYIGSMPSYS